MNIFTRPKFFAFTPYHFIIWTEAIIHKKRIIDTNQAKIHYLQLVFVFPNPISILTPSKLDDYFVRPIAFQPVTIFNVWRVNCHVRFTKKLMLVSSRSSLLTLPGTLVISRHSRIEYWFPQHCLCNAATRLCNLLLTFFEKHNSDSIFLKSLRSSLSSLLTLKCY